MGSVDIISTGSTVSITPPDRVIAIAGINPGLIEVSPQDRVISINEGNAGSNGASGFSGWSGISGWSGFSGQNGILGGDGASGYSGLSGYSGFSGSIGLSGFSGFSGATGTGTSGFSGFSGVSGFSGFSGINGVSGFSGFSGAIGQSGFSGFSGAAGSTGPAGFPGPTGAQGESGFSGFSGVNGLSGFSGFSGVSGFSGFSGAVGQMGVSGYSGFSGISGFSGFSGLGLSGFSGFSGATGPTGTSGFSGFSGLSGFSGFSGQGVQGPPGPDGQSGYSGRSGYSGFSGSIGISGFSGFSGATGTSGFSGFSGVSGFSGFSGISGFSGFSGTSGTSGFSGFSGVSGFSGFSGISGFSGFSGASGISGFSGFSGLGTVATIGVIGSTPNASGGSIAGGILTLQPASGSFGGVLTTAAQTIAGNKTFAGNVWVRSAAVGALGVATANETAPDSILAWDSTKHILLGGPAALGTSAGVFVSYDQTLGNASIGALSPSIAWLKMIHHADNFEWRTIGSTASKMNLSVAGALETASNMTANGTLVRVISASPCTFQATNTNTQLNLTANDSTSLVSLNCYKATGASYSLTIANASGVNIERLNVNAAGKALFPTTTAASSSITGAVVIGDGSTAATNVGIGGGAIYAGTLVNIGSSGLSAPLSIQYASTFNSEAACAIHIQSAAASTALAIGTDNAQGFSYIQAFQAGTSWTTRPLLLQPNGGYARVGSNTAASSTIVGAFIIGDGATAATNVAIGGGAIYAGGPIVSSGASSYLLATSTAADYNTIRVKNSLREWHAGVSGAASGNWYLYDATAAATRLQVTSAGALIPGGVDPGGSATLRMSGTAWISSTTAASSSITGALSVGDGTTLASSVGIGDGKIVAGTRLTTLVGTSNNSAIHLNGTSAALQIGITFSDNSADKWIFYKNTANNLHLYDAVNTHDFIAFTAGTPSTGIVTIPMTTAASSSITGALVVGTGTAATSVGMGNGKIFAGTDINAPIGYFGELTGASRKQIIAGYNSLGTSKYSIQAIHQGTGYTDLALNESGGNVVVGAGALATNATVGFLYVPTCAGTPTGTPGTVTGYCPIVVDTTNNRWYFYSGGAWRNAGP